MSVKAAFAVHGVADDWVAETVKMPSDLVKPAAFKAHGSIVDGKTMACLQKIKTKQELRNVTHFFVFYEKNGTLVIRVGGRENAKQQL